MQNTLKQDTASLSVFCTKPPYFALMYTRQEMAQLRKNFWTSFGQYLAPLPGAGGEPVNWLNYKTGVRHLYFRMDADNRQASIAIEMRHPDTAQRQDHFYKLEQVKNILEEITDEPWQWESQTLDEDGRPIARIGIRLEDVNVFNAGDWPAIISFLKPRMLALDRFWDLARTNF